MKRNLCSHQFELVPASVGLAKSLRPLHTLQILVIVSLVQIHEIAYYARIQLKSFEGEKYH